jgi:RecB family exonuclease
MLKSWSHSRLVEFERCKFRTYLKHVQKAPEPERPLPPGKTEHANDRGSRVHDSIERYVKGEIEAVQGIYNRDFQPEFDKLRELYAAGLVTTEEEWGFNLQWQPADWQEAWHRAKLDAFVRTAPGMATVIDYKTGAYAGNEVKHGEQLQLYALDAFLRFPDLEEVTAELWYVDNNHVVTRTWQRDQALKFRAMFERRGTALTTCTEWPPNPNVFTCKYCMYGESGDCKVSAKDAFVNRWRPLKRV